MPSRNLRKKVLLALCIGLFVLAGPSRGTESEGDPEGGNAHTPQRSDQADETREGAPSLDRILQQMDEVYQGLRSYQAAFDQESETKAFQRRSRSSGRVYFLKPSRMRWSYLEPERREVYLSGEQLRIYMPDRNQVIDQSFTDAMPGMAPASLFMGVEVLAESFRLTLAETDRQGENAYCLRLIPKKEGALSVEEIFLWVGTKDFLPLRTESRDVLGNRTTLVFRDSEVNVPLKEELFRLEVPPDTEVLSSPF